MMLISLRLDRAVDLLRPGQQGSPQNSYSVVQVLQYTFVRSIVIISPKPCMAVLEDLVVKKGLSVRVCGLKSQNKTCFPIIAKNESRDLSLCFDELTQLTPAEPGSPQVLFGKRTGRRGGPVRVLEVLRQSSRQSLGKWL